MEVILNQDFPSLGYVGDKVKVRPGYARNFLIPRGVAIEATARNRSQLRHRLTAINAKKIKLRAEAEEFAKRLGTLTLEFVVKMGSQGKAFGAVTAKDIEAALLKEGVTLDRRQIKLTEPIKKAGEFTVMIKLHSEVLAPVAMRVSAEVSESQKSASEGERKSRGRKARAESSEEVSAQGDAGVTEGAREGGRKKRAKSKKDASSEDSAEVESDQASRGGEPRSVSKQSETEEM